MNREIISERNREDMELLHVFHLAERVIDNRNIEVLKEYNLTPTQFYVMSVLANNEPLHIGEIIERLSSTSGNMTVVIRNMEKAGCIARLEDPKDKRSSLIALTEEGRKRFYEIQPKYGGKISDLFAILDDQDKLKLKQILKKFYEKEDQDER